MLRERGMNFNREKLEYRKKLMEEKEKAACLMQHAASLEVALKERHREGSRIGRPVESEMAKDRRAAASISSLMKTNVRDREALTKFRRARKTALQHQKRQAKVELEEGSKG